MANSPDYTENQPELFFGCVSKSACNSIGGGCFIIMVGIVKKLFHLNLKRICNTFQGFKRRIPFSDLYPRKVLRFNFNFFRKLILR